MFSVVYYANESRVSGVITYIAQHEPAQLGLG